MSCWPRVLLVVIAIIDATGFRSGIVRRVLGSSTLGHCGAEEQDFDWFSLFRWGKNA